ncbi:MAG TPA: hypothetical protein VGO86_09125 [Candidatus Dormibacteraeota bacterium]|jgi:hypothetical protein
MWQPTTGLELFQSTNYDLTDTKGTNAHAYLLYQIGTSLSAAIPDIRFPGQHVPTDYFPQGPYLNGRYRGKETNDWTFLGDGLSPEDNDPLTADDSDPSEGISSIRWWHPTYPPGS